MNPRQTLTPTELQRRLAQLDRLAHLMDEAFEIPGTNVRLGVDSIVGLIPGVGDALTLLTHAYLVHQGHKLGVRKRVQARMLAVALVDCIGGAVPLVGDVFDVFWRANRKNVELLRQELIRQSVLEGRVLKR